MRNGQKGVTMRDIALRAGVTVDAVSKALRDRSDISEKKKQEIHRIAEELGYVPSIIAKNLRSGTSNIIAVVFNDFYNPYFSISSNTILNILKEKGFKCQLIFCDTTLMTNDDIPYIMINNYCGIISFVEPTNEVASFFKNRQMPFTLVGIKSENNDIDCVYTDDYQGGKHVAVEYIKNNYKYGLYISNSPSETSTRRKNGFKDYCDKHNKKYECYTKITYHLEEVFAIIKEKDIDFVFCFSDALAIQLIEFLKREKYNKPIRIVGFDNLHKYYPFSKEIDSVGSDLDRILEFACNNIIDKINEKIDLNEHTSKMFPTYFVNKED